MQNEIYFDSTMCVCVSEIAGVFDLARDSAINTKLLGLAFSLHLDHPQNYFLILDDLLHVKAKERKDPRFVLAQ